MDLNFTAEEEHFRVMARDWIGLNLPDVFKTGQRERSTRDQRDKWYKKLADKGWLCASWPKENGGPGWSLAQQYIFKDEVSQAGGPAGDMGVTMIGPMLIEYGSEPQKQRYLPKIAAAEETWCQGYSEPNAGSDLASLALRAERENGDYVLNGQKIWTSYAHESDMIFVLTRTDISAKKKQAGISFMVMPIDTPGIEIRPIKQITGEAHFFETFFTDVKVSVDNLIGEENHGWVIAKQVLAHERVSTGAAEGYRTSIENLTTLARTTELDGRSALENAEIRQRLARLHIDLDALRALGYRSLTQTLHGQMPGPESSIMKLHGTELFQRICDLAMDILGPAAQIWNDEQFGSLTGDWPKTMTWSRATTIFSGTSEIQRNIIAERVLGLPKG